MESRRRASRLSRPAKTGPETKGAAREMWLAETVERQRASVEGVAGGEGLLDANDGSANARMGAGKSLQGLNPSRHHWLLRCDQRKTRFHKPANEGAVCLLVLGWNSITAVYYRIGSHIIHAKCDCSPLLGFPAASLPLRARRDGRGNVRKPASISPSASVPASGHDALSLSLPPCVAANESNRTSPRWCRYRTAVAPYR